MRIGTQKALPRAAYWAGYDLLPRNSAQLHLARMLPDAPLASAQTVCLLDARLWSTRCHTRNDTFLVERMSSLLSTKLMQSRTSSEQAAHGSS